MFMEYCCSAGIHQICVNLILFLAGLGEDPSNYRLISLLSVFSKTTEKLLHTRFYNFLEQHKFCIHSNLVFIVKIQHCMH